MIPWVHKFRYIFLTCGRIFLKVYLKLCKKSSINGTIDFCHFLDTFSVLLISVTFQIHFYRQCYTSDLCHFLDTFFCVRVDNFSLRCKNCFLFIASTFKSSTKVAGNIYCSKNAGINYPIRYNQRCMIPLKRDRNWPFSDAVQVT